MTKTYSNENDVKAEIKKILDAHKWFHWPAAASPYGVGGVSDRLALRDGVFLAIEAKFGKNKPTPQQHQFLNRVRAQSAFGFVVSEKTIEIFRGWMTAFDNSIASVHRDEQPDAADVATMTNAIAILCPTPEA